MFPHKLWALFLKQQSWGTKHHDQCFLMSVECCFAPAVLRKKTPWPMFSNGHRGLFFTHHDLVIMRVRVFVNHVQGKEGDQWEGLTLHDFKTPVWRVSWSLTGNILAVSDASNNVTLWKEAVDGEWAQVTTVQWEGICGCIFKKTLGKQLVAQEWTGKQKLDAVAPLYTLYNCPLFHELECLCNTTRDAFPQLRQGGMVP